MALTSVVAGIIAASNAIVPVQFQDLVAPAELYAESFAEGFDYGFQYGLGNEHPEGYTPEQEAYMRPAAECGQALAIDPSSAETAALCDSVREALENAS